MTCLVLDHYKSERTAVLSKSQGRKRMGVGLYGMKLRKGKAKKASKRAPRVSRGGRRV